MIGAEVPERIPVDLLSQGISVIHATGVVTSDPVPAGFAFHTVHSRFEMRVSSVAFDGRTLQAGIPLEVYWSGAPPEWGDEITITGGVRLAQPPRNPGEFNIPAYLARNGIFAELFSNYPGDNCVLAHGWGNPILTWARRCRGYLQRHLTAGLEDAPELAGLVQTITLGLKQETSPADRDLFQHVGALHLFVVNGLHVALLAGILSLILKPFGIYRRAFALLIIPILFTYALITGLNPGSVRAAIMAAVIFGFVLLRTAVILL